LIRNNCCNFQFVKLKQKVEKKILNKDHEKASRSTWNCLDHLKNKRSLNKKIQSNLIQRPYNGHNFETIFWTKNISEQRPPVYNGLRPLILCLKVVVEHMQVWLYACCHLTIFTFFTDFQRYPGNTTECASFRCHFYQHFKEHFFHTKLFFEAFQILRLKIIRSPR